MNIKTEDILMLFDLLFVPEALLSIWRANGKADMSQWLLWQAVVDTITRHSIIKEPLLLFLCILFNHWHKLFYMRRTSQNSSMDVCWSLRGLYGNGLQCYRENHWQHTRQKIQIMFWLSVLRQREWKVYLLCILQPSNEKQTIVHCLTNRLSQSSFQLET